MNSEPYRTNDLLILLEGTYGFKLLMILLMTVNFTKYNVIKIKLEKSIDNFHLVYIHRFNWNTSCVVRYGESNKSR